MLCCALALAAAAGCIVAYEEEAELVPPSDVLDFPDEAAESQDATPPPQNAQGAEPPGAAEQPAPSESGDQRTASSVPGQPSPGEAADTSVSPDPAEQSPALDPAEAMVLRVGRNPLGGCELCHVDVADQYTPSAHFSSPDDKVGCTDCHGPSDGHVRDENNEVSPDRVFATADEVNGFCVTCHECKRPRKADTPATAELSCTDCHQAHSLARVEPEKAGQ